MDLCSARIKVLLLCALGCFIYAIGIDAFIIPNHLLAGGLSGIAVIGFYLTGIPVGTINIFLNIPVLLIAYRWLGGWSVFVAIYGTICSSLCLNYFSFLGNYHLTETALVGSIMGGLMVGFGLGIVYRSGATAGGIDPLAKIVNKYWGIQMGSIVFLMNCVILSISACIFSIEIAVITLISLYISAQIANKVVVGFAQQKAVYIISAKSALVSQHILDDLGRGATLLEGEGAYSGDKKKVIMAVIRLTQITKLKAIIYSIDPKAFLVVTDATEVIGHGFSKNDITALVKAIDKQNKVY